MELNLGFTIVQLSDVAALALFWAVTVSAFFIVSYVLFLKDRGPGAVTRARATVTIIIGTLIMLATYADILSQKTFAFKDCFLLAFVAAHGWTAEDMVQTFIMRAAKQPPQRPQA